MSDEKSQGNTRTYILFGLLVLLTASFLRILPLFEFSAYGIDFGIHAGITESFIESSKLYPSYHGWGASYQYFPMLYWITGSVAMLLGVKASTVLPWMPLVFGGVGVLFLYIGTHALTKNRTTALLAGLFLATNAIHLCQTSHPYPMLMGHFFILLLFLLYFLSFKKVLFYYLMFPVGILLVFSHHLSAYICVISFIGAVYTRILLSKWDRRRAIQDLTFVGFQVTVTFLYWILLAPPLDRWVSGFFHIPLEVLIGFFILTIVVSFFILRKLHPLVHPRAKAVLENFAKVPGLVLFIIAAIFWTVSLLIISLIGFGFIDITLNPYVFILGIPTILFLSLGITGLKHLKDHPAVLGWFLAILLSLTVAVVTWSRSLFPERHLEYLVVPMSIAAALALMHLWSTTVLPALKNKRLKLPTVKGPELARIVPAIIVILIIAGGFMSAPETISGRFSQGISDADYDAIQYISGNCSNNFTVATDHRLGNIINTSHGFTATFENCYYLWTSENIADFISELEGNNSKYPKIGYILIDDNMLNGTLNLVDNGPKGAIISLVDWEYEKFHSQPFELIFRTQSGSSWAEVYGVNWTYIEQNYPEFDI